MPLPQLGQLQMFLKMKKVYRHLIPVMYSQYNLVFYDQPSELSLRVYTLQSFFAIFLFRSVTNNAELNILWS